MAASLGSRIRTGFVLAVALVIGAGLLVQVSGNENDPDRGKRRVRDVKYRAHWNPVYVRAERITFGSMADRQTVEQRPTFTRTLKAQTGELVSLEVVLPRMNDGTVYNFTCEIEIVDGGRERAEGEGRECYVEMLVK